MRMELKQGKKKKKKKKKKKNCGMIKRLSQVID